MDTLNRHWLILRMIPRRGKIATTEIRSRLQTEYGIETTLRTIQRDLLTLEASEFPLECDSKKPAGWNWRKDAAAFDIPNMDPVTALTFKLAETYLAKMLPHGVLPALQPYLKTADERLKQMTESSLSRWPDKVRVVSRNLTTIPPVVSPEISDVVYTAVLEEKCVKVTYRTVTNKMKTYEVNPLGMAFVDGLTYLIASLNGHTDPVLLLLHRIRTVDLLDKSVNIPDGFCMDDKVSELLTFPVGKAIHLKLRFSMPTDIQRLEESPLAMDQKILSLADSRFELEATVDDTQQLRWWLHGFGARVEVLEPMKLRQEFVALSNSYAIMYGSV